MKAGDLPTWPMPDFLEELQGIADDIAALGAVARMTDGSYDGFLLAQIARHSVSMLDGLTCRPGMLPDALPWWHDWTSGPPNGERD